MVNIVKETKNLSKRTKKSFGYQWTEFADMVEANRKHFLNYIYPVVPEFMRGKTGLDVACGFGRHLYYASKFGTHKMVGMDFSDAIWQAKRVNVENKNVFLVKGDIYHLPFKKESFDFAYSIGALHHLPDPERGFHSILPFIKKGGAIFIWVYSKKRKFLNFFLETFRKITMRLPFPFLKILSFFFSFVDYFFFIVPYKFLMKIIKFKFLDKITPEKVLFDCNRGHIQPYYEGKGIQVLNSAGIVKNIRFILTFKPDIIHLYGFRVNIKWRPILWLLGFRYVIGTLEGLTNTGRTGLWRVKLDVWTSCFLKKYIAVSIKIANYLKANGFPEKKLEVIYNGIEVDKYKSLLAEEKESLKKRLGIPLDSIVISCVANLRPVKGHVFLIDTLSILKELNFSALIIGGGTLRDALIKYSQEKGLKDKVHFLGQRLDIPELLSITDIFILSSLSEGMPVSLMEAMASGLPVVATNVGGVSELVVDGETGFFVPSRNPSLLAEKIKILIDNKTLRETMGIKGRARIKDNFTLEAMVKKTEELYKGLINNLPSFFTEKN